MINDFRGQYRWLSNFHECDILHEGIHYPSTEHAYQAAKSLDTKVRNHVAALPFPRDAKRFSRSMILRPDWEEIKYQVMLDVTRYKYNAHSELREKLIATGDQPLIEGNTWGDTYWGVCNGIGQNNLGKILMQVRKEVR